MFREMRRRFGAGEGGPARLPPPEEVAETLATPAMVITSALSEEVRRVKKQLRLGNPAPITREQAIEAVAMSEWARHWGQGMCRLAGIKPGTPEWESCVERLSRRVAEKVV